MAKGYPKVTIVTVNFNGLKYLKELFGSVFRLKYPRNKLEVIFVDNLSTDNSVAFVRKNYPRVKIIKNDMNNYCKAINLGIGRAKGKYVALINNDLRLDKDWLIELVKVLEKDKKIACAGGKVLDMKGKIQNTGHYELPNFYWGERGAGQESRSYREIEEVPSLSGAAVICRKEALDDAGAFDEDFVMYGEDADMSIRLIQKGWKLLFVPASLAYHKFHGTATEELARHYIERNRLLFLAKHYPHKLSSSLLGSGHFTAQKGVNSSGKIYSIFPEIIMKLIKHHPLDIAYEVVLELFKEIAKIVNYENDILVNKFNEMAEDQKKANFELTQANKELQEKIYELNILGNKLEELRKESDLTSKELKSDIFCLKEELNSLSSQLHQRMDEVLLKDYQLMEKSTQLDYLQAQFKEKDEELFYLKDQLSNVSSQLKARMDEVLEKDGQLIEKDSHISGIKEELDNISNQLRQRMDEVLEKDGQLIENKTQLDRLQVQFNEKEQELFCLKDELNNISNQLRQRMDEALRKEEDIFCLKDELDNLSNQLRQRLDETLLKDGQIIEKEIYISSLKSEIDNLSNQLRQRLDEIFLKDGQIIERGNQITSFKDELDNISSQLRQRLDEILLKDGQIIDKDSQLASLKDELNNISNQLRQRMDEVLLKESEIGRLKDELAGIYNSEGFRYILRPLWTVLWNLRAFLKTMKRKLISAFWLTISVTMTPVFLFLSSGFLLEHISGFIFSPLLKIIAVKRKIRPIKDSKISLVIPNYNGIDCLKECLPSVFSADGFTDGTQNEVLVVDDGSTDESVDYIKTHFPQVSLLRNKRNRGFGFTCNRGIKSAKHEIVVLINNDIILTKDFLSPLVKHLEREDVFAVTPKLYAWDRKTFVWGMHMGRFKDGYISLWNEAETKNGDRITQTSPSIFAIGGAMVFRKSDFLWLGGFDSVYRPNCWEDIDISYRAWKRGLKVLYEPRSLMYHKGRATLTYERPKEIKNELLFTWKNITDSAILKNHLNLLPLNLYRQRMSFLRGFFWALDFLPQMLLHRGLDRAYIQADDKKIFNQCMLYYRNFERRGFRHLEENEKRHVLLVTSFMPFPLNAGGRIRIHTLAKLLNNKFDISLLTLINHKDEVNHIPELKKIFKEVYAVFPKTETESRLYPKRYKFAHSHVLVDKFKEIQKNQPIDLIQLESNELLYLADHIKHIPIIYTEHDSSVLFFKDSYYQIKEGTLISNFFDYLKRVHFHCSAYKSLDRVILLSREDRQILRTFFPSSNFSFIPTGVDLKHFSLVHSERQKSKRLIYVGHYPHYPNEDAVIYFAKKIFPYIRKRVPDVEFLIVGSRPTERIKAVSSQPNIRLIADVDDVWPYLRESAVFVNSSRISGGIKGKVLEAMATGIPVVSTRVGAFGINANNGKDILIADTPFGFARRVVKLLKDNALYSTVASHARKLVEEEYDWKKISQSLGYVYEQAMNFLEPSFPGEEDSFDKVIELSNEIVEEATKQGRVRAGFEFGPEELHIELTYRCDSQCIMCDLWDSHKRAPEERKEMTLDEMRHFVEESGYLKKIKTVVFSGGEAFLRKDIEDICGYFIKKFPNISLGILTNGIDTQNIIKTTKQILHKYKPKHLWLGSSLDGIDEVHERVRARKGAFPSLERTIRACKKEGINITLTFTLNTQNFDQLIPAKRFADSMGVELYIQFVVPKEVREEGVFNLTPSQLSRIEGDIYKIMQAEVKDKNYQHILQNLGGDSYQGLVAKLYYLSHLVKYQRNPKRYFRKCVAGTKFAMLSPFGDLYFCPGLKNGSVGNVREEKFDNLWTSRKAESVRDFISQELCHCWLVCVVFPVIDEVRASISEPDRQVLEIPLKAEEKNEKRIELPGENTNLLVENNNLNELEYQSGKVNLQSTPRGIGIGAHWRCNADCVFCLGGYPRLFDLHTYRNFFEKRLSHVLPKAEFVNLCGFGELLLMPRCEEFLDYINHSLPVSNKIITTNGTPLSGAINNRLTAGKYSLQVSLHASEKNLHRMLTHTEGFERIIEQVRNILSVRRDKSSPSVNLVFILNTLNIENLPDFVELASRLGVDSVIANYMTVYTPSQLKLSCFFKQNITNRVFREAEERAAKSGLTLGLPPKFGGNGSKHPKCSDPWKYLYVETEGSILPCCFAGAHIGYLYRDEFEDIWNGDFYRNLRKSLVEGEDFGWCKFCYKNKPSNVNDIRSHVSFRPDYQEKILKGITLK